MDIKTIENHVFMECPMINERWKDYRNDECVSYSNGLESCSINDFDTTTPICEEEFAPDDEEMNFMAILELIEIILMVLLDAFIVISIIISKRNKKGILLDDN